jgi:hypothetical protein
VHLLPPGYEWRVVRAHGWTLADLGSRGKPRTCATDVVGEGVEGRLCGAEAVAIDHTTVDGDLYLQGRGHCEEHLGSVRWLDNGVVWGWRAHRLGDSDRVLVTASRAWDDPNPIRKALNDALVDRPDRKRKFVVVHGGARGGDRYAAEWAVDAFNAGHPVEAERHTADWQRYGPRAGILRNVSMVKSGVDMCLAFIRANSRGATHCANAARRKGILTVTHRWPDEYDDQAEGDAA